MEDHFTLSMKKLDLQKIIEQGVHGDEPDSQHPQDQNELDYD